jgi:hypothetical protein
MTTGVEMAIRHTSSRRRPVTCIALILAVIALAIPVSAATAAGDCSNPTTSQYGSSNDQFTNCAAHNGGGEPTIAGLPFTGLDIGVLAIAAAGLLGAGFTLRRLSDPARRSSS